MAKIIHGNLFLENISQNFECIFTPYTFSEKATPFFNFILVFGGVAFSDWRCDYYFLINNFDEYASTYV